MPLIVTLTDAAVSALTMITAAMGHIGQLAAGEEPSTEEQATCLAQLNSMLDSWRNRRLYAYAMREEPLTLEVGSQTYTVGSGGDLNINRPVRIESAYASYQDSTYPVQVIDEMEWAAIPNRTDEGYVPEKVYYQSDAPVGSLNVWMVPGVAAVLYVVVREPLLAFTDVDTTTYLPPGWRAAIETNLAIRLAPSFERPVSAELREMARQDLRGLSRVNTRQAKGKTGLTELVGGGRSSIITGR